MSNLMPVGCELLYCNTTAGNPVVPLLLPVASMFTLMGGMPPCVIPAGFWDAASGIGRSLAIKVRGRVTYGAGGGVCRMGLFFVGSPVFVNVLPDSSVPSLSAITGNFSSAGNATSVSFTLDADVTMRSIGNGPTSVLAVMGEVRSPGFLLGSAPSIPTVNVSILIAGYDVDQDYYLHPAVTGNVMTSANIEIMKVWGEN